MDRASQSRSVNVQALEQALVLAETALELKERSNIAAKQVDVLREAALRSHRSYLALQNSSTQLLSLAKSLILNTRNTSTCSILSYKSNFEECRQRLAAILDQHLEEVKSFFILILKYIDEFNKLISIVETYMNYHGRILVFLAREFSNRGLIFFYQKLKKETVILLCISSISDL